MHGEPGPQKAVDSAVSSAHHTGRAAGHVAAGLPVVNLAR
jgi:hypothetical protein